MKLYILRHAHAHPGEPDAERPLSTKGRETVSALARFLQKTEAIKPAEIHHSTLLRARQTARLLAGEMQWLLPTREFNGMEPESTVGPAVQLYSTLSQNTLLVGHETHLSRLISHLLTGSETGLQLNLKKNGLVCLERIDDNTCRWNLRWVISPKLFR